MQTSVTTDATSQMLVGGAVSALSNHQPDRQPSPDIGVCSLPLSNGAIVCARGYHQRVPYDRGDGTQGKDGGQNKVAAQKRVTV